MAHILSQAEFIAAPEKAGRGVPCFSRALDLKRDVSIKQATLHLSALGAYAAAIDGQPVGDFFLAPGWTEYKKRLQYQSYDVTKLLRADSVVTVLLGEAWWGGRIGWAGQKNPRRTALIGALEVEYADGSRENVLTDARWRVMTTPILFSSIYDGETVDMNAPCEDLGNAELFAYDKSVLIPQEGEIVREKLTLQPRAEFVTPAGERVLDFGQNLTGYVRIHAKGAKGAKGDAVELSFAEVLDKDGNFYTENMRSARNKILLTLGDEGEMDYAPTFSFQGFRYVRLDRCPEGMTAGDFTAVAVYSDIEQTGSFECGVPLVNQLYENILWGQRSNFLDVPTDCPQRDERLGWTGDAQVFARTASYNFKVDRFFTKWLHDLNAAQYHGVADVGCGLLGLFQGVGDFGGNDGLADGLAQLLEQLPVLGPLNGGGGGAQELHVALLENALLFQLHGQVQAGLAADAGDDGVGPLIADDLGHIFQGQGLHIDLVGNGGIGHDGGGVGVAQHHLIALFLQRQTGLGTGVVKFRRLADDDGAGADDQNLLNVCSLCHNVFLQNTADVD